MTKINKVQQDKESFYSDEIDQPYPPGNGGSNEIQEGDPRQGQDRQADQKRKAKIEPKPQIQCPKEL
jgi:hypothetical protein